MLNRARRCEKHGLAAGPNGLCALCRRDSLPAPKPYARWVIGGILLSTVLVSGGALFYRAVTRPPLAAEPEGETRSEPLPASSAPLAAEGSLAIDAPTAELDQPPASERGESLPLVEEVPAPAAPVMDPPAPAASASSKRPSEEQVRAALSQTPIVMYATSWCGACKRARQFLAENGLRYQEIDPDRVPGGWEKVAQLAGKRAVPVIVVDGVVTQGLSPRRVMDAVARSMERRLGVSGIRFQPK